MEARRAAAAAAAAATPVLHAAGPSLLLGLDPATRRPLEAYIQSLSRQVAQADEERDGLVLQLLQARGDAEREKQARRALEGRAATLEEELAAAGRRARDLAERGAGTRCAPASRLLLGRPGCLTPHRAAGRAGAPRGRTAGALGS